MTNKKHPLEHTESRPWIAAGPAGTPICKVELPATVALAEQVQLAEQVELAEQVDFAEDAEPLTLDPPDLALATAQDHLATPLDDDEGVDDPETADTTPNAARLFRPEARKAWGVGH